MNMSADGGETMSKILENRGAYKGAYETENYYLGLRNPKKYIE